MEEGFNIELVLADSLYGEQVCRTEASVPATLRESSQFIQKLTEYQLAYVVAISF
jgi:SRSO17 transposase